MPNGQDPLRKIPRMPSSRANSAPTRLVLRPTSPEMEYVDWQGSQADAAATAGAWSPTGWLADQARAAYDGLAQVGGILYDQVVNEALDVGGTIYAMATGREPTRPGPIFEIATGLASSVTSLLPASVASRFSREADNNVAGYVTLPSGQRIPVAKAGSTQATGERATTDRALEALTKGRTEIELARIKSALESRRLAQQAQDAAQAIELKRQALSSQLELQSLQKRAYELALERYTSSAPQRALWGRPSTIDPTDTPPQRILRSISAGGGGATMSFNT